MGFIHTTQCNTKFDELCEHSTIFEKVKGVFIQYAVYLISGMVGFLYHVKYTESNKTNCLRASKLLIEISLNLDNSCVKLRGATFFLTNLKYSQSVHICDRLLTFPPIYKVDSSYPKYLYDILMKVHQQLFEGKGTEEIEAIMKAIVSMFYSSAKCKSLPGNYDITEHKPDWIFHSFTNIVFHDLYMYVTLMTAEKWVVPKPILYELLSLSHNADHEGFLFPGIHLDPMFVCLQTKFLCYHSMENVNGMAEMLTLMSCFITENLFTTKSSCVYLNMCTYCQIKAGHHSQSCKSILQSFRNFPSWYNTASGNLKIVLQILNSFCR